jgi:hypothetical protein
MCSRCEGNRKEVTNMTEYICKIIGVIVTMAMVVGFVIGLLSIGSWILYVLSKTF